MTIHIRDAIRDDAAAIARIYNQGIDERIATLETATRTALERAQWLALRTTRHPVLVAEDGTELVGWSSLNQFNSRAAYDHVADISVYVDRGRRGQGVGKALLEELANRARALGYHKLVLSAFPYNLLGRKLYERCGFREVGIYREQGMLDGKWVDVLLMERLL